MSKKEAVSMSPSRAGVVVTLIGIALILVGAAMYVLPGPGLPFLLLGLAVAVAGAALWFTDRKASS
ncbi:hypothetical protein ACFWXA_35855 [Streptomyces atroolivaceus]|uniref:hypothetical protein n=1 Tax=Streptomyces atroolivaceus TaxID=66869 RepID=UPI0036480B2C